MQKISKMGTAKCPSYRYIFSHHAIFASLAISVQKDEQRLQAPSV